MAHAGINKDPSARDLRLFGLLLPVFTAVFGYLVGRRTGSTGAAWAVWGAGAVLSLAYLALPPLRRPVFLGWSRLTYPLGWVVSHVVLAVVFFLVVTPVGFLLRLLRHDPLSRRFEREAPSYWIPKEPARPVSRYFRQF